MKKRTKPYFSSKEREIIRTLHRKHGAMTANEIAETTRISYITVKKYLLKLYKDGVIRKLGEDGETYKES